MVSIISSVMAIALPSFALWKSEKHPLKRPYIVSVFSFAFCSITMIAQLITLKKQIFAGSIGTVEDTIQSTIMLCTALLIVTVILNLLLLGTSYEK